MPVQQQYAPPAAQQPQYAPAQQQYAPPAAQQQQYAPAQQQYAPPAAQQPQGAPPQQRYAPPPRQAAPPPPPAAAAPAVDWYRPPESDALVPWNGNVFQKPYDSWREWRSISFGFVSRTISMPETTMESSSYGAPSATLAAAELKTSVKGAYLDLRPGGLFFGTTTMKVGTKETDLYTFGGYLGFPFAPRVLDLGIPDVQVGVILPEAFLNLSYGSIDDTAGSVDVKTEHLLLNTGLRLTGLRVTGLDCFVAELHLGMLAYDLDAITVTSTVSDPVLGDTEAIYDGTRSKFGFSVAPEFRLGVVF